MPFKTLHDLDYCKPSSVTYVSFLKLLGNVVEDGESRDHMAERVFTQYHESLCVSRWWKFQEYALGLARAVSVSTSMLSRQNRSVGRSNNTRLVCNEELVMFLLEISMSLEIPVNMHHARSPQLIITIIITHTTALIARLLYNVVPTSSFMC